jgi:hypothetical protein
VTGGHRNNNKTSFHEITFGGATAFIDPDEQQLGTTRRKFLWIVLA